MIAAIFPVTIRTATICNVSTKSVWSLESVTVQRGAHHSKHFSVESGQFERVKLSSYRRKLIEKDMGFPSRPLSPYFRFMQQIRPTVVAEYPHLKAKELYTVITDRWKLLDSKDKEIFSIGYRNDLLKYSKEITNFNRTISVEDKRLMKEKLTKITNESLIKSFQKRARQLNKPTKPPCSFLRFLHAQKDRQPNEKYLDYLKRMSSKWQTMSETEKKKYETNPEEMKAYCKALLAWETAVQQSIDNSGTGVDQVKSKQNNSEDDEDYGEENETDEEN